MGVKTINLVHHLMDIHGEITEKYLKENQKWFDEALDTTMPIFLNELMTATSVHMVEKSHTQRFRSLTIPKTRY